MSAFRMNSKRIRRWSGAAALGLLVIGSVTAIAQEPESEGLTNDAVSAEVLARLSEMMQSAESVPLDDLIPADATNSAASFAPETSEDLRMEGGSTVSSNRFQNASRAPTEDGRSRSRRSSRPRSSKSSGKGSQNDTGRANASGQPAEAGSGAGGLDYSVFRMIVERNIFDPNRFPRRSGPSIVRPPPTRVDSVTLVGTMTYEKGTFAFFDGTSSEYKKALKQTDIIAGYKVTNIVPDGVTLALGTNQLQLHVGMQLRREENGPWTLGKGSGSSVPVPASLSTNAAAATAPAADPASSAAESEIIKKLMQRRAQE
jgi:hypothetical protein